MSVSPTIADADDAGITPGDLVTLFSMQGVTNEVSAAFVNE